MQRNSSGRAESTQRVAQCCQPPQPRQMPKPSAATTDFVNAFSQPKPGWRLDGLILAGKP